MNMYQLLYLQSKLQPAPDCRGTREGRGGCPAAVCRRKCLHKFESDRKSFFNITLFFHHVYRGGKKQPIESSQCCPLPRRWDGGDNLQPGYCKGRKCSLHTGITCVGNILLAGAMEHLSNICLPPDKEDTSILIISSEK